MDRFRRSDVGGSVSDFDKAIRLQPSLEPYMWQRGLSLYYGESADGVGSCRCCLLGMVTLAS
ncbi:unnamed protein product, partial [Hapterophycus canaliculatus]